MDSAATRPARRGRPGYSLDELLAVVVTVFNERGYDGTSMEDLSARLGIGKSSIYHHVGSKEELLGLALDRSLNALFAVTEEPAVVQGRAIDRLEHLVRRAIEVLVAELPYVTLLLRVRGNTPTEQQALRRRREFDRFVSELVAEAASDGQLRADIDPGLAARLLFGAVNSLIEWYRPERGAHAVELADAMVRMTFDGLRVR
ncbi:MAG TPA: TetR/AcrR family transcriptional regulator [Jatrophihabitans sp.]|nr:TetR/AcrR family transcriptional regulator [Jatrophihabitans sp.]